MKVAATEAAEGITAVARAESGIGEGKMSWKGGMVDDGKCGKVERKDEMVEREGGMVDVGKCGKVERKDGMVDDGKCGKVERKDGMVEREGGIVDDGKCGKVERKDGMVEREGAMAWRMMVNEVRWKGKMEWWKGKGEMRKKRVTWKDGTMGWVCDMESECHVMERNLTLLREKWHDWLLSFFNATTAFELRLHWEDMAWDMKFESQKKVLIYLKKKNKSSAFKC